MTALAFAQLITLFDVFVTVVLTVILCSLVSAKNAIKSTLEVCTYIIW